MLSNQAADNAAAQFNASSTNQTNQFVNSLASTIDSQNAARNDAMNQFNVTEANRIAALNQNNALEADRLQATLNSQIEQFNSQLDFNRKQFNTQNSNLIEQSNVQ
jgi:flagellar biosynthesis chaperone FliJ